MQQHAAYARACAVFGNEVSVLSIGRDDAPLGEAQVISHHWPVIGRVAQVARGPVWKAGILPDEARLLTGSLVGHLRKSHRAVIISCDQLKGTDPALAAPILPVFTPVTTARLSLKGDADQRMARQHGKWRNRLRRAMGSGLRVEQQAFSADPNHWLFACEAQQAREKRYKSMPSVFTQAWRSANGAGSTRLFVARQGRETVAAMLFLRHGRAATYHIGWAGPEGRQCAAHNLILHEAANWFAGRGCKWLDLGTLDTVGAPGLARFKLGSGAEPLQLGATCLSAPATAPFARLAQLLRSRRFRPEPG